MTPAECAAGLPACLPAGPHCFDAAGAAPETWQCMAALSQQLTCHAPRARLPSVCVLQVNYPGARTLYEKYRGQEGFNILAFSCNQVGGQWGCLVCVSAAGCGGSREATKQCHCLPPDCLQFGGQAPGTSQEEREYAWRKFGFEFDVFDKIEVSRRQQWAKKVAVAFFLFSFFWRKQYVYHTPLPTPDRLLPSISFVCR